MKSERLFSQYSATVKILTGVNLNKGNRNAVQFSRNGQKIDRNRSLFFFLTDFTLVTCIQTCHMLFIFLTIVIKITSSPLYLEVFYETQSQQAKLKLEFLQLQNHPGAASHI